MESYSCYPAENRLLQCWLSWIHACLSSTSFSFLLNGSLTSWITSSRGIRQGDLISPLLFLLVTQNLSTIFNKDLSLNLVLRLNQNLPRNFNHLMFVDDLITISKATRQTTKNCLLCLNIYHDIIGQKPNLNKLAIYLPSWCNKKIANSISMILGIKLGNFSFIYLGASISPKRLHIAHFNFITNRVNNVIQSRNHLDISTASREVFLNNNIFSIPTYYLFVFLIPN